MLTEFPRRLIRSFVRREGRITPGQEKALSHYFSQYGLSIENKILNAEKTFSRQAPLIVEIGFGMGQSLLTMASQHPEQDYIGIEVHRPGVGSLLAGLHEQQLSNVQVFCADAVEVLNQCIADNSLAAVYIFFPDPWPKKRHHKRRIIQPEFINLVHSKLQVGGIVHLATDWENYAEHMLMVMSENNKAWENLAGEGHYHPRPDYRPLTKFEQRGQRLGHGVWDLMFKKR